MTQSPGINFWTPERVEALERDHAAGLSAAQIARRIGHGVTRNAVIGKWKRIGLTRNTASALPVWTKERTAKLIELWLAKRSADEIGLDLGVTAHAVSSKVHSLRIMGALPKAVRNIAAPSVRRNPHASAGLNMKGAKSGGPPAVVFGPLSPGPKKPFHGRPDAFSPLPGIEPVPFLERAGLQCRWPVGGEGTDLQCCGARVEVPGYCEAHAAIAYQPSEKKKKPSANELMRSLRRYA